MKIAIRYYTRSGNTKKLADAISEAVGVEAKATSESLAAVHSARRIRANRTPTIAKRQRNSPRRSYFGDKSDG